MPLVLTPVTLLLQSDGNLYTIPFYGSEKRYLTSDATGPDNGYELASWSPDGSRIVYSKKQGANAYIWTMNADGSDQRQLTFGSLDGTYASFSPDEKSILFTSNETGNPELWLINVDGTDPHPITHTTGDEITQNGKDIRWSTEGSFSPDGTKIAYSSTDSGHAEIWVVNTDGTNRQQLTFADHPNAPDANNPIWSPEGDKIAFFGGFATINGYIFTINPDGSDREQLTSRLSDDPSWTFDGQQILFDTPSGSNSEAWIMNRDGSNQRELAATPNTPSRLPAITKVEGVIAPDNAYTAEVYELYNEVLARNPNADELATDIIDLAEGTSGGQLRRDLAHSPEAVNDLSNAFENALYRSPDAAELAGMEEQLANAGATQASITPGSGVTTLIPGAGTDLLTAAANTPTSFDFSDVNFGNVAIVGFDPAQDAIRLPSSLVDSFTAVQADMSATTSGTLITLDETHSIMLDGVMFGSLTAANFHLLSGSG